MEVEDVIRRILTTELFVELPPELIGIDDGLRSVIGLDSLGFMELRVQCENEFEVLISDEDFTPDNFRTIRALSHLVGRLKESADAETEGVKTSEDDR